MVSQLDSQGLAFAAVTQSNSITNLVLAFVTGLASGSIVLISQYWGKDTQRIQQIAAAVMLLNSGRRCLVLIIQLFPVRSCTSSSTRARPRQFS